MTSVKPHQVLKIAGVVLFGVGVTCTFFLFLQFADVYFSLQGTKPTATDAQIVRYRWTAGASITSMAIACVLALIVRKRWAVRFGTASLVGLLLAIGVAVVFMIPNGQPRPEESSDPLPSNYEPCYSGSGNCN
jgi:hypothetical protein